MIIELAPDDFVVMGTGFDVPSARPKAPCVTRSSSPSKRALSTGTVDPSRRLNGDERHVSLPDKSTILRVRVAR